MATRAQDVQLNIRAVDYSRKTTDQVVDSLKQLSNAQDAQVESAKKGATTAQALTKGYDAVNDALKALAKQDALLASFDAQNTKLDVARTRLDAARQAQIAYNAALTPGAELTKSQVAAQDKLARAVAGAEKKFATAETTVANTTAKLAQLGITSANAAEQQAKITTAQESAVATLEQLRTAYAGLDQAIAQRNARLAAQAQAEATAAQQAALAASQQIAAAKAQAQAQNELLAAQQRQEAETERELNIDRIFTQAQRDQTAATIADTAARQAQAVAIAAAANAAEQAARAAARTARPAGGPTAAVPNLQGQVQDIAAPAAAALRSVDGLEASIAALQARVTTTNGPVQNYRESLREATDAQRALASIAGNVDAYNRQLAAVRAARQEFVAQRTVVNDLIATLRSGAGGDDIVARLARAQGGLRQSALALSEVTAAARVSRDALDAAGINTARLAQAESNLVDQAQRAASAVRQLNTAYNEHGEAVRRSNEGIVGWLTNGRNTVSYAQRIKGELLGLAAAYVGVNAAVNLGKDTLDTYSKFQALQSRLLVAAGGDAAQAADEYKFLTTAAKNYGFVLLEAGSSYAKFAIAAKASNFATKETRFIFESLALASKNARLSTEEFNGVLLAFQQIVSKGKLSAEELNQLGERLPGAFAIAAQSLGKTTGELAKAVEANEISVFKVIDIAGGIGATYGKIGDGTRTLNAAQADFRNAADLFQKALAEKGFVDAYTDFLTKLTDIISGESGDKLAGQLAAGFRIVLGVITKLVDHADDLKNALEVILALKLLGWSLDAAKGIRAMQAAFVLLNSEIRALIAFEVVGAIGGIGATSATAAGGVGFLAGAVGALRIAIGLLLRAIPYVAAALLAFEVIKFAWDFFFDKNDAVKAATDSKKAADKILSGQTTPIKPAARDTSFDSYTKSLEERNKDLAKLEKERLEILEQGAKKDLKSRLKYVDQGYDVQRTAARELIKDKTALELRLADIQEVSDKAQANERLRFNNEQAKTDESASTRRKKIAEDLAAKLKSIQADLDKRATERDPTKSFKDRTEANQAAVADSYDETFKKIRELRALGTAEDKRNADAAEAQLKNFVELRKQDQARIDAVAELQRLEKQLTDTLATQKAKRDELAAREQQGTAGTPAEITNQANAITAEFSPAVESLGAQVVSFAEKIKTLLTPVQYAEAISKAAVIMTQNNATAQTNATNLKAAQEEVNRVLAQRQVLLDQIKQKEGLGLISDTTAAQQTNQVYDDFRQKIIAATNAQLQLLEATRSFGPGAVDAYNQAKAAAESLLLTTQNQRVATDNVDKAIASSIATNGVNAFSALADSIAKTATGQQSLADGFHSALQAAGQFFSSLLKDIAAAIIKQLILNAIVKGFGATSGIGGAAASLGGTVVGAAHTGGVVGQRAPTFGRNVPASIFAGAQRLHSGGIPGLAANEVPTILERNEEVLTRDDPRHVLNGGGGGGAGGAGTRFVLVDDRSKVAEAMASSEGEKVTLLHLRRNIPTLKQLLK